MVRSKETCARHAYRRAMPQLLIVHHTVSPALEAVLESVLAGTSADGIEGVDVRVRPALSATAVDVLGADAYLLGTPANIGYMSGALKHFFDQIYYPTRKATAGRPYGLYVHGNEGLEGALRSVESVTKGLGWRQSQRPVEVRGEPAADDLDACWELGATMASGLMA